MLRDFIEILSKWDMIDTWTVITGALAAMSCALPGAWLFLRRQSLLGDALSHSVLPGIVLAYLAMSRLESSFGLSHDSGFRMGLVFAGAAISGVLSAVFTELVQKWGRLDRSAAMGVVFTSMFAFGLLLIQVFASQAHIDAACVLYGSLETSVMIPVSSTIDIPRATVTNAAILLINGLLVLLFFKELRLSTFDPGLAASIGFRPQAIQVALMAMTAATVVAAFDSVGAILVIAMLIVPPATARLLTDRLGPLLLISVVTAGLSAIAGHVGAITMPVIFARIGYPGVNASTAGTMAVAAGGFFVLAVIASPRHGSLRRLYDQLRLRVRIASEDLLGALYRREELAGAPAAAIPLPQDHHGILPRSWIERFARRKLEKRGLIDVASGLCSLTEKGREAARNLVRAHRLWEAYMARHFVLPGDHLHSTAEQVEHYISPQMQTDLAMELDQPSTDPHGKEIP
jgi:manganese/zinc/iron transport system permease protein